MAASAAASDQFSDFCMWKAIMLEKSWPEAPPTSAGVM